MADPTPSTDDAGFSAVDFLAEATGGPRLRLAAGLRDTAHVLGTLIDKQLRSDPNALPYPYLRILDALEQRPGASGRQLARAVVVTPQTVATILKRLEANDHVRRSPHEENRRAERWWLTDRGTEHCAEQRSLVERELAAVFQGVSRREIADIARTMDHLSQIVLRAAERAGVF